MTEHTNDKNTPIEWPTKEIEDLAERWATWRVVQRAYGTNDERHDAAQRELLTALHAWKDGEVEKERAERLARGRENHEALRQFAFEARTALSAVRPPTPEHDNPLYYPLLFLTEVVERTLHDVLRQAFEAMRDENEGAARFLRSARAVAKSLTSPKESPETPTFADELAARFGRMGSGSGSQASPKDSPNE